MVAVKTASRPEPVLVSRNSAAQMSGRLIYLLTRVGLPPITLRFVSLDEYGIWSTCFLIIGYISIGAFGVANVYLRFAAEYNAKGKQEEIGSLMGVGLAITSVFSIVALALLWLSLPWVNAWFKIPEALQATADVLILGTVATMLLDMSWGGFAYILQGINRITQQTWVWMIGCLLETALIVVLLMEGYGVYGLLWAFVARYVFSITLYAVLVYRAVPGLKLSLKGWREKLRLFAGYGGILQLTGLVSMVMYSFDRFCAGMLTGVGAVGLLDIGQKFPMMASQLFGSSQSSFLTALTHLYATDRHDEIERIYLRGTRYLNMLNGVAMGFMAPFGMAIVTVWMGADPRYREAGIIMALATIGYHLHVMTGMATSYFQSTHKAWRPLLAYMVPQMVLVALALAFGLVEFGPSLLLVVASMAGARALSSLFFLAHTNFSLQIPQWRFLWFVMLPGLMPYFLGYLVHYAAEPWLLTVGTGRFKLLPALAGLGVVYLGVVAFVFSTLLLDKGEKSRWVGLLKRRRQ